GGVLARGELPHDLDREDRGWNSEDVAADRQEARAQQIIDGLRARRDAECDLADDAGEQIYAPPPADQRRCRRFDTQHPVIVGRWIGIDPRLLYDLHGPDEGEE